MARYVDADKLVEMYERSAEEDWNKKTAPTSWAEAFECAIADIDDQPTADVVPKSEGGAECPTCYGTGRIGTTNWLTKNMTKKQIAEEKAKAIAEHEQHIKSEVAREIIKDLIDFVDKKEQQKLIFGKSIWYVESDDLTDFIDELKKKYTEGADE